MLTKNLFKLLFIFFSMQSMAADLIDPDQRMNSFIYTGAEPEVIVTINETIRVDDHNYNGKSVTEEKDTDMKVKRNILTMVPNEKKSGTSPDGRYSTYAWYRISKVVLPQAGITRAVRNLYFEYLDESWEIRDHAAGIQIFISHLCFNDGTGGNVPA